MVEFLIDTAGSDDRQGVNKRSALHHPIVVSGAMPFGYCTLPCQMNRQNTPSSNAI
ncbi:MAG: hypothetical protein KDF59_11730 [Nitrosomonas sp.]|nr:hypothetical protein [Nitrosomonas sp.]